MPIVYFSDLKHSTIAAIQYTRLLLRRDAERLAQSGNPLSDETIQVISGEILVGAVHSAITLHAHHDEKTNVTMRVFRGFLETMIPPYAKMWGLAEFDTSYGLSCPKTNANFIPLAHKTADLGYYFWRNSPLENQHAESPDFTDKVMAQVGKSVRNGIFTGLMIFSNQNRSNALRDFYRTLQESWTGEELVHAQEFMTMDRVVESTTSNLLGSLQR